MSKMKLAACGVDCAECDDFPCAHYKEWASWDGSHQKAMEYLLSLKEVAVRRETEEN